MCGVCGLFGGEPDWSSAAHHLPGAPGPTRRAERARQVQLMNEMLRPLSVRVSDWQGSAFLVAGPTGKQELADSLAHVWRAVQVLTGRIIDPLAASQ